MKKYNSPIKTTFSLARNIVSELAEQWFRSERFLKLIELLYYCIFRAGSCEQRSLKITLYPSSIHLTFKFSDFEGHQFVALNVRLPKILKEKQMH